MFRIRRASLFGMTIGLIVAALGPNLVMGQDTGQIPTGQIPTVQPDPGQIGQPQQETDRQTNDGPFDFNDLLGLDLNPQEVEFENERIQPFVGRSLARYREQELLHPRSLIAAGSSNAGGGGGNNFNRGGAQSLQPGAESFFEVTRGSIRTRIVPGFTVSRRVTGVEVSSRFQQRMARLPATRDLSGYQIRMDGRTAVLTGTVASEQEKNRIVRMARLEPGVYKIDNQIQVVSQ